MNTVESLRDVVQKTGYAATIDGNLVLFRWEGTRFRFQAFPDDTAYARLILTFSLPDGVPEERLLLAANDRNRALKAIKTVVSPGPAGFVTFNIEMFAPDSSVWEANLDRMLRLLREAADAYFEMVTAPEQK